MTMEEKLDNFYDSAIEDARQKSINIIEEYKASLTTIYNDHKTEALRKSQLAVLAEEDHCARERNRILASESIEIRKRASDKARQLIDILYDDVEKNLINFMETPEYTLYLTRLIKEAKTYSSGDDMTLYINPSDASKKADLESKTGVSLTVSTTDFMGGIRAVISTKHLLIDNSFSTKLKEGKETFRL